METSIRGELTRHERALECEWARLGVLISSQTISNSVASIQRSRSGKHEAANRNLSSNIPAGFHQVRRGFRFSGRPRKRPEQKLVGLRAPRQHRRKRAVVEPKTNESRNQASQWSWNLTCCGPGTEIGLVGASPGSVAEAHQWPTSSVHHL